MMRIHPSYSTGVLAGLFLGFAVSPCLSEPEVWVDDDWAGSTAGQEVEPGKFFGTQAFDSIEDAIAAVDAGGIVNVAEGYYEENMASWKDFEITKSLTLLGEGSDVTVIGLSQGKTNGVEIRGASLDVTLQGLTFTRRPATTTGPNFAIRVGETASTFTNLVFRDVIVEYAAAPNVELGANGSYASVTVEDSWFRYAGTWGFRVAGPVSEMTVINSKFTDNGQVQPDFGTGLDFVNPGPHTNIDITGCNFDDNFQNGLTLANVSNVTVTDSTMNNNEDHGINLWEWVGDSSNILIENCEASGNMDGILIAAQVGNSMTGVTITGCTFEDNWRHGILLFDAGGPVSDIEISNNTLTQSDGVGANAVIFVNNVENIDILNNSITQENIHWGIWLQNLTSGAVDIEGNDFHGTYGTAAWVNVDTSLVTLSGNAFYVSEWGAFNEGGNNTLDATGNWWGTTNPSEIADMTSGDVLFDPFLTPPDFDSLTMSALDTTNNVSPTSYTNSNVVFSEFSYTGEDPHVLYYSEASDFSTSQSVVLDAGQTTATLTLSTGDALKTVYAKFGYFNGESNVITDTILLDTTPPVTEATAPSGVVNASSPVIDVEFSANDAGSGIQNVTVYYQFDGGAWTELGSFASSPVPFNIAAAGGFGEYGFYTVGMDNTGNVESKAPGAEVTAQVQADVDFHQIRSEDDAVAAGDSLLLEDVADDDLINGVTGTVVDGGFHSAYTGGPAPITDGTWNTDGLTALANDLSYPNPSLEIEWDFTDFVQGYVSVASIDKITIFAGHAGDGSRAFINSEVEVDTGSGYVSIGDALVTGPFGQPMPGEDTITFVTRDDLNLTGVQRIKFRFWAVSHNSTGFFQAHDDNITNPPLNYPNQGTIIKEIDVFGELDSVTSVNEWFMLD